MIVNEYRSNASLSSPSGPNLNNLDNFAHNGGIKTKRSDTARRDLRIYIRDRFAH
jgi:hypothetical protein